ncbi:MAG TPA: hypothetical protein VL403_14145 [Candidatus Kryptonia bacterium]|nr:hypothetical protein [Candidatus Kryptonia bacterium]
MAHEHPLRWRRAANSAAFSTLLVVVLVLGYLALTRVLQHQPTTTAGAEAAPTIEIDRFAARHERGGDGERLSVSLRLRTNLPEPLSGFVFVVARNDHVTPHIWAIWPPEAVGAAITAGGHFHGAAPASGQPLTMSGSWERITAVLPHDLGAPPFDTVTVYFVSPQGQIILSRPFELQPG